MRRDRRYTGPSTKSIALIAGRCGGVCEFPGCLQPAQDPHHRYERGMGGVGSKGPEWINNPSNILAACRHHNDWCSNQHPAEAKQMGWLLEGRDLPWLVPVQTEHDPLPVWLNDDGSITRWPS
jgi:hypothetical protein